MIVWRKVSAKRYCASIGPLSLEVRMSGFSNDKYWTVGTVLGQTDHGQRGRFAVREEAQQAAELVARQLLVDAAAALTGRRTS